MNQQRKCCCHVIIEIFLCNCFFLLLFLIANERSTSVSLDSLTSIIIIFFIRVVWGMVMVP